MERLCVTLTAVIDPQIMAQLPPSIRQRDLRIDLAA
jgi:hypothetical protein